MPSRKRSNIGVKTTNARKKRIRLALECKSDKEKRLNVQRIRQSKLRASESFEKRNERLDRDKKRKQLNRFSKMAREKRLSLKQNLFEIEISSKENTLERRQSLSKDEPAEDNHEHLSPEIKEALTVVNGYSCYTNSDSDSSILSETY